MAITIQALYRFYAFDGALLYIGITCNLPGRLERHRESKEWWPEVGSVRVEHFSDRASVLDAERKAIISEKPRYNIKHVDGGVDASSAPRRALGGSSTLPCGLEVGVAYALGLRDGSCPVGVVVSGNDEGVVVTLFDWLVGMFCGSDEWISSEEIARWRRAEFMDPDDIADKGYVTKTNEKWFDMDPLAAFQTRWKKAA